MQVAKRVRVVDTVDLKNGYLEYDTSSRAYQFRWHGRQQATSKLGRRIVVLEQRRRDPSASPPSQTVMAQIFLAVKAEHSQPPGSNVPGLIDIPAFAAKRTRPIMPNFGSAVKWSEVAFPDDPASPTDSTDDVEGSLSRAGYQLVSAHILVKASDIANRTGPIELKNIKLSFYESRILDRHKIVFNAPLRNRFDAGWLPSARIAGAYAAMVKIDASFSGGTGVNGAIPVSPPQPPSTRGVLGSPTTPR